MLEAVLRPQSAGEALSALSRERTALLAGGTLLMPRITSGTTGLRALVSLDRSDLAEIDLTASRATLGAMVRLAKVLGDQRLRALHPAVRAVGHPTLRNAATVGGNLFAEAPYGDLATALLALDAAVRSVGAGGTRERTLGEWLGATDREGEIVTSVSFDLPVDGTLRFRKAMRRAANSAAIVTVAAHLEMDGDIVRQARVALGGVGATPLRSPAAEAALTGRPLDAAAAMAAGEAARADVAPFDDAYASAWYRLQVLPVHVRRALTGA